MKLTENQLVQEEQYQFPYHYADLISDRHKYFKFIESMDLLRNVKGQLRKLNKSVILDAGCGDGRLCYELRGENYQLAGVDYSASAISFARAFNPGVEFFIQDLRNIEIPYKFDVIVLMEVLEHLIPDQISHVLSSLSKCLHADGRLLVTVPTTNLRLSDKHYQHFNRSTLSGALEKYFVIEEITGYCKNGYKKSIFKFLRSIGNLFYPFRKDLSLSHRYFAFYKNYYQRNVSAGSPETCDGIMAICRKIDV